MSFPGIGISGYRSFYEPVWIDTSAHVNVLLGPNNSGKSSALRLLSLHLSDIYKSVITGSALGSFDARYDKPTTGPRDEQPKFKVLWPIREDKLVELLGGDQARDLLSRLEDDMPARYLPFAADSVDGSLSLDLNFAEIQNGMSSLSTLSTKLKGISSSSPGADALNVLQEVVKNCMSVPPEVAELPLRREVGVGSEWNSSGTGLINLISRLKNTEWDQTHLQERLRRVESMLGALVDDPSLELLTPADQQYLSVRVNGRVLPLSSLGSGIEELILIVVLRLEKPEALLVLEEPDVHLHPRMQRKLMQELGAFEGGDVVVATHSAHLIDAATDNVQRVSCVDGVTSISRSGSSDLFEHLRELGYRPSDLLQANSIIWVEGPSDRIYLNHWIREVDPVFREGVEYSIMFFGGSLLAHLQAELTDDLKQPDLVDLWKINQNLVLVVDSDRTNADSPLKPRVKRLQSEIEASGTDRAMIWVTSGRTIEDCIDREALEAAVLKVHPTAEGVVAEDGVDILTRIQTNDGSYLKSPDKVRIAEEVVASKPQLSDEVRQQVELIVELIRRASS